MITANGTYPWSFVTQIPHNIYCLQGGILIYYHDIDRSVNIVLDWRENGTEWSTELFKGWDSHLKTLPKSERENINGIGQYFRTSPEKEAM